MPDNITQREEIHAIQQRVTRVETTLENISVSLGTLSQSVDNIARRITDGQRTPWAILISFSGLIITIMGGIGYLSLSPVQATQANIREGLTNIEREFDRFVLSPGHPTSQVWRNMHEAQFLRMREQLDDLRVDFENHNAKLGHLESVVAMINAVDVRLGTLEQDYKVHSETYSALNARQDAEIAAIERETFNRVKVIPQGE